MSRLVVSGVALLLVACLGTPFPSATQSTAPTRGLVATATAELTAKPSAATPSSPPSLLPSPVPAAEGPAVAWERLEAGDLTIRGIDQPFLFRGSIMAITTTSDGRAAFNTSRDGRTWRTLVPPSFPGREVGRLAASDREILGFGSTRSMETGEAINRVWSSRDALLWRRLKVTGLGPGVGEVWFGRWTRHGWIALAQTFANGELATNVLHSADGRSWKLLPRMPLRGGPGRIASGKNGTFISARVETVRGRQWTEIWHTRDMRRWTRHRVIGGRQPAVLDLATGPRGAVAVGLQEWWSRNGTKWTRAEYVEDDRPFMRTDVVALADGFVAVGHGAEDGPPGGRAWISADGQRWARLGAWPENLLENVGAFGFSRGVLLWGYRLTGYRPDGTADTEFVLLIGTPQ